MFFDLWPVWLVLFALYTFGFVILVINASDEDEKRYGPIGIIVRAIIWPVRLVWLLVAYLFSLARVIAFAPLVEARGRQRARTLQTKRG